MGTSTSSTTRRIVNIGAYTRRRQTRRMQLGVRKSRKNEKYIIFNIFEQFALVFQGNGRKEDFQPSSWVTRSLGSNCWRFQQIPSRGPRARSLFMSYFYIWENNLVLTVMLCYTLCNDWCMNICSSKEMVLFLYVVSSYFCNLRWNVYQKKKIWSGHFQIRDCFKFFYLLMLTVKKLTKKSLRANS